MNGISIALAIHSLDSYYKLEKWAPTRGAPRKWKKDDLDSYSTPEIKELNSYRKCIRRHSGA